MSKLARRYSIALYELAEEEKKFAEYRNEVKSLIEIWEDNFQLKDFLSNQLVSKEDKKAFLDDVFRNKVNDYILNFMKIVVDKGRAAYLEEILKDFDALGNEKLNIRQGILYTPMSLSKEEVKQIEQSIGKKMNEEVHLKVVKDPSLIAGIKVVVNDKIFDNSVSYKLTELRNTLRKVGDA
ncbi:MAG: F0F1 ATP synthase subunit delta [Erysipelotrichaceae bacterium]|nr:F0F1 ATP synthase subunit delta [Erysipelotrichaceae bacterium]